MQGAWYVWPNITELDLIILCHSHGSRPNIKQNEKDNLYVYKDMENCYTVLTESCLNWFICAFLIQCIFVNTEQFFCVEGGGGGREWLHVCSLTKKKGNLNNDQCYTDKLTVENSVVFVSSFVVVVGLGCVCVFGGCLKWNLINPDAVDLVIIFLNDNAWC